MSNNIIDLSYIDNKKEIKDLDVKNKTALVRVDFNVPVGNNNEVLDNLRITEAYPTIKFLLENNAKVVLLTHFKRPNGWEEDKSVQFMVKPISEVVGQDVVFIKDKIGSPELKKAIEDVPFGKVILLENIRFYEGESINDASFSESIASLGDVFINDAFGTMHREHASTAGVTKFIPSALGFLPIKEISYIRSLLSNAKKPITVILAGGKVSTKIGLLKGLMEISDYILIGGAMSFTFLKAQGYEVGNSFYEVAYLEEVGNIIKLAQEKGVQLFYPQDIVCTEKIENGAEATTVSIQEGIPSDKMGVDSGAKTIEHYKEILSQSQTIFWNGPVGVFEVPPFDVGTKALALHIQKLSREKADMLTFIGGGETALASRLYETSKDMSHISTGGGALLELLEGVKLPGIQAISSK